MRRAPFAALRREQLATLVTFVLFSPIVRATQTVTRYLEVSRSTDFLTHTTLGEPTESPWVYTSTRTIKTGITPTAHPTATSTSTDSFYGLTYVDVYLPEGAVKESDLASDSSYFDTTTIYVEDVYITAPSSCPTPFTYTTYATVDVLSDAAQDVTPTSFTTDTYGYGLYSTTVTAFLPPNAVAIPTATLTREFTYSFYVAHCTNPATLYKSSGSGSGSSSTYSDDDEQICSWRWGCTSVRTWIIVVATVLPSLFVLGFLESFLWFRALMRGRRAWRFGTLCWTLISLWVYCFTAVTPARSREDQIELEGQWKQMSVGTKLKLWLRWGFRHRYPADLLGPEPSKTPTAPKESFGAAPASMTRQEGIPTTPRDMERGEGAPEARTHP